MPVYLYRREDGTTFEYRQKFTDDPLVVDPVSGQPVKRVVQAAGIVFKGSGFYVNDSKDASRKSINTTAKNGHSDSSASTASSSDAAPAKDSAPAKETAAPRTESSAAAD
jgi:putative FmdB family regulatory protein